MPPASAAAKPAPNRHGRLNGGQSIPGRNSSKAVRNPAKSILGAEASATLRDQLSSDYDAQFAVERELVLRLACLLWRLCRATTMETGLFEVQADQLRGLRRDRQDRQPLERLSMRCSGGSNRAVSTETRLCLTSLAEQNPSPAPCRNRLKNLPLIPPLSSPVAF